MKNKKTLVFPLGRHWVVLGALATIFGVGKARTAEHDWLSWRGSHQLGSSETAVPPIRWSETENVAWKTAIPGLGHSSPIVSEDLVVVTSAVPVGEKREPVQNPAEGAHDNFSVDSVHQFLVCAFDRSSGVLRWKTEVARTFPHEGGHYTGSLSSHSVVTDGELFFASFGSRGLYALDRDGSIRWSKSFGQMNTRHAHGEGSSPALMDGVLVINWDHEGQSRIYGLEAASGAIRWQQERKEMTSWSTPFIVSHDGAYQVIVSATERVRAYDLHSGRFIWECAGLARNVVASPVALDGVVVVGNSYDRQAMMAIRLKGASGDITGTENVLWRTTRMTPYVPSPLIYNRKLYFLRHNQGVLSCLDPITGKTLQGPFRLGGLREIFASPVAADGRLYVVGRNGVTLVLGVGEAPQAMALNRLEDQFSASPALTGKALILRGEKYLYCIGQP